MGRNRKRSRKISDTIDKKKVDDEVLKDTRIVDMKSRLSYPVVLNNGEYESDDDFDDEETIEFDFRPRKTFLSNSCLVCSRISVKKFLCKQCKMVSYCTEDHKKNDEPSHRDLCKVLREANYLEIYGKLFDVRNGSSNPDDYRMLRMKVISMAESLLNRYLELWEKEIILYPRACLKCHWNGSEENENSLECCPDCKQVFWCKNHKDNHSKWCFEYKLFHSIILAQTMHGNVDPKIPNVHFTAPNLSVNNFHTVMSMVNEKSNGYRNLDYFLNMDFYNYTTLSHMSSIPLTTLYGLQKTRANLDDIENLVLHLIGAEFHYEGMNLRVWEKLFHHLLPSLKNLSIFIIGPELIIPELPDTPVDIFSRVKICRLCKLRDKKIKISFIPRTLYHDFCHSSEYKKPDFTCLFNPGLYRATGFNGRDTWPRTILELCKTKVPILVTAYTEREIPMDIQRIKAVCPDVEIVLEPTKNPFASLKPDRNFVSDESIPLIYKNYFLSVVKQTL